MKKYLFLVSLISCFLLSCNTDELDPLLKDKHWRAMFITDFCKADTELNDLILEWYGIDNAAGYVVQVKYRNQEWANPLHSFTLPPDVNKLVVEDLQYGTDFQCRIKVLSKKGPEFDSEWCGDYNGDDIGRTTRLRYAVPKIINVSKVTETTLQIDLNLSDYIPFLGQDGNMCYEMPKEYAREDSKFVVDSFA